MCLLTKLREETSVLKSFRCKGFRESVLLTVLFCAAAHAEAQHRAEAPEAPAQLSSGPVKGASYTIDPTHTFVLYEMSHYGTTTNRGRFSTSDGTVKIDPSGATGSVEITMDISSINSGVDLLNRHLQSKDFFNVADYPTGKFIADRIVFDGDKVSNVPGLLTLLGTTKPVTLTALRFGCYVSPIYKRQVCGGDFETTITRSDFGITWGLNVGFENKVHLDVQIEAIEDR